LSRDIWTPTVRLLSFSSDPATRSRRVATGLRNYGARRAVATTAEQASPVPSGRQEPGSGTTLKSAARYVEAVARAIAEGEVILIVVQDPLALVHEE
jgi:hypothetical protein